ncbi:uncharacterized protein LOC9658635 [Selaginella moellendorffii]|nr:uncharacterized protein LOC9658635 [Selaginella moellendorffii]|eukprot:XP_002968786.2 uncharacterized protein LOC9658635 [Selaginella moellendorffii]
MASSSQIFRAGAGDPVALRSKARSSIACSSSTSVTMPLIARKFLRSLVTPYLKKNVTASSALELVRSNSGGAVKFDHFAFRTFGVDGFGIDSIAQLFLDLGYECRDELRFPAKKLRAFWYAPPLDFLDIEGDGVDGPLPRIFISELLVNQLSSESQEVIKTYTGRARALLKHAPLTSVLDCLPWENPSVADYERLAQESEYAAWTLANGYALNHLTISVHRLNSELKDINKLNEFLQSNGIKLNKDGGILKVSPDRGLLQSSTVADLVPCTFSDGEIETPASYIEFAQRLVLPAFQNLGPDQLKEWHRRDGFEVGNADKIFESTSSLQTGALKQSA